MTLPGLDPTDPQRATRTLDDEVAAILDVINESTNGPVVLVAHSGANAPVSLVLDRHPELVRRVVWVDSGPLAAGTVFAPDLPEGVIELPLPPFDVLAQRAGLEASAPPTSSGSEPGPSPNRAPCCVRPSS